MPSCAHIAFDYNMTSTELHISHFQSNLQLILNVLVISITQNSCVRMNVLSLTELARHYSNYFIRKQVWNKVK